MTWGKTSWRDFPIKQQPKWPDNQALEDTINQLNHLPSLVFSGETRMLRSELKAVQKNKAFVLQVGNCSESFSDCNGPKIHNFLRIILQMAMVISFRSGKDVVKIGRVAGQYAKPRSSESEIVDGVEIPCYKGDIVNDYAANKISRTPDPKRMLEGYFRSASTLNLIRAFTQGGYIDIKNLSNWKEHFFSKEINDTDFYKQFETELTFALENGYSFEHPSANNLVYTSHEALLLPYEEAFVRIDTTTGGYYSTSAHMLWVGERTRDADEAHIEFVSGVGNPIGIKVGPGFEKNDILKAVKKVNPNNEDDKVMLIVRMGVGKINEKLPVLIRAIKEEGLNVIWCCDPMHGNTFSHGQYKVRSFQDSVSEITSFFKITKENGVIPGGVHLEITGDYVSECIGGITGLNLEHIPENYTTKVDPRLNAAQALEIAFVVGNLIN